MINKVFHFARVALIAALMIAPAAAQPRRLAPGSKVDLELVLAVDVSASMSRDEHDLQRRGYVKAFREPSLITAIKSGDLGRVAVTYVQWSSDQPTQTIPWTIIASAQDARTFADKLEAAPLLNGYRTGMSGALIYAADLIDENAIDGARRVIDVSGDGANNLGAPVTSARDTVVRRGIVINGLPIAPKQPLQWYDVPNLALYYHDCVIGGAGAFSVPTQTLDQFGAAIRGKLVSEVAGIYPQERLFQLAQARAAPRADCLGGEKAWNSRMMGFGDDRGPPPVLLDRKSVV